MGSSDSLPATGAGTPGRVRKAPESFLGASDIRAVWREAAQGRRDFIRGAFAA